MQHNIILPDLGQTTSEAKIVQWLHKPGEYVARGQPIVAVETDKVDMEVEAFASGYLRERLVAEGNMASALAPVAILTDTPDEPYRRVGEEPEAEKPKGGNAAPAARALARKLGVDLSRVTGTGAKGLITSADVQQFADGGGAARPETAADAHRALATMAATASAGKREIPHFYAVRDLEVTRAALWRAQWNETRTGAHATFNDVFVWCAARALADVPRMNLACRDGSYEQRAAADILLVVARDPALLLLPLADPRALDWEAFLQRMRKLASQTQTAKAAPLLAISNLGMHGVKEFSAIIPPGCTSVLALGAVREVPVVKNGAVIVERVATATLSADHRVIDGVTAARFLERMQFHLDSL